MPLVPSDLKVGQTYKHLKRQSSYMIGGFATLQCSSALDNTSLVLYRGPSGKTWARPVAEFCDGRFELVADRCFMAGGKL